MTDLAAQIRAAHHDVRRAQFRLKDLISIQQLQEQFPTCTEDGCDRASEVYDLCRGHARRLAVRAPW